MIQTNEEFEQSIDKVTQLHATISGLESDLDNSILAIRDQKGPAIEALKKQAKDLQSTAAKYCRKHKRKLFADGKKSAVTKLSEYGFRESSSITKLNNQWTTQDSIEACLEDGRDDCVITTEKLNKEALEKLTDSQLAELGLRRAESQNFYLTPRNSTKKTTSTKA